MNHKEIAWKVNWIFLGLLMLVPGLLKLFSTGAAGVTGMLTNIGFPIPAVFAWILIIAEIVSGILILARWQTKYVVYVPMIILLVAALTVHWGSWSSVLIHLAAVTNYWILGQK